MFRYMDVDGDDEIDSREFARVVRADASRTKPKSAGKMSQDNIVKIRKKFEVHSAQICMHKLAGEAVSSLSVALGLGSDA